MIFRTTLLLMMLFATPTAAFSKPNVVIILTDDHTLGAIIGKDLSGRPYLPNIAAKLPLARRFTNTYFVESLCWPSRATLFTGMYPHNHGIADQIPEGSFSRFMAGGLDLKSWPIQVQAAGYRTGQFGKFLNGLSLANYRTFGKPRGFLNFTGITNSIDGSTYNWSAVRNGTPVTYSKQANGERAYMTDVLRDDVLTVIRRQGTHYQEPFALMLSVTSPHLPAEPSATFKGMYAAEPLPTKLNPAFNERDVSDKPTWLQQKPRFTGPQIAQMTTRWRASLESARSVDKAFLMIWNELATSGKLATTYIIFASDNGYIWGPHRLDFKIYPYQDSIRSVTYIWGPDVVPGEDDRLVSNLDWFGTFMDISGRPIPDWVDGRSLLPLLRGENPAWRSVFLVQGYPPRTGQGLDSRPEQFLALVTADWKYIRYDDGQREFYNLTTDPYERVNRASALASSSLTNLDDRMDALYNCAGQQCRDADAQQAPTPTFSARAAR